MNLSERNKAVLAKIALDKHPKEIAGELGLSYKGVQWHITRLKKQYNRELVGLAFLAKDMKLI